MKKHMKKQQSKVLIGAATLAAAVGGAGYAQAANTDLQMTAVILAPVQITETQSLQFGTVTVDPTAGGTVTVDLLDERAAGGGVSLVGGTGAQSGGFKIIAAIGEEIKVTAPATAQVVDGLNNMNVTGFDINGAGAGNDYTHNQIAATDEDLRLGAVLNVPAGQAPGSYSGTVTLTANYQ